MTGKGINIKDFKLTEKVRDDDPEMSHRAWSRVLRDVYNPSNIIGYATYTGTSSVEIVESMIGWKQIWNRFVSQPVHIREDWERLKSRADFLLTDAPVNNRELHRRDELNKLQLHELKAMAGELGLVKKDRKTGELEVVSKKTLVDRIVKHELNQGGI